VSVPLQLYGCKMDTVNLAADKFTDGMGSRMTEFEINPAKGTAEMRRVRGWVGVQLDFGWWGVMFNKVLGNWREAEHTSCVCWDVAWVIFFLLFFFQELSCMPSGSEPCQPALSVRQHSSHCHSAMMCRAVLLV